MAWTGIRGGDALPRSSAFLFALAQVQVDPLVWGGQATPDPATLAPLARSPSYRRRTDALTRLASTGRAPVSLVTYGSFSGPRYYTVERPRRRRRAHDAGLAPETDRQIYWTRASWRPRPAATAMRQVNQAWLDGRIEDLASMVPPRRR